MKVVREDGFGNADPWPEILTPEQGAVVILMEKVGMNWITVDSLDEFVRRADLYTTHVASCLFEDGEEVVVTRKIITSVMNGCRVMWSDSETMGDMQFDHMIRQAKEAAA